jgi:WD40 repeat protein
MFLLGKHDGRVAGLAFAPDGRTLAVVVETTRMGPAFRERSVVLWDVAERKRLPGLDETRGSLSAVFAPDGETLAAEFGVSTVRVWDVATGKVRADFCADAGDDFCGVVYAPGGEALLATVVRRPGGRRTEVEVIEWDLATKEARLRVQWHLPGTAIVLPRVDLFRRRLAALTGPPDSLLLCGAGTEPERVALRPRVTHHTQAFAPDGRTLVMRAAHLLTLFDLEAREVRATLRATGRKQINDFAFSADSRLLATASNDRQVRVHDLATGELRAAFDWKVGKVDAVAFAPDGMTAAAGSHDGRVVVWDVD